MMNIQILSGLRNGHNTDLKKGTIRNADAVLLLLNETGGIARSRDLKEALRQWRPERSYGYLFQYNPTYGSFGYGFVGKSFEQATTQVEHSPADWVKGKHYSSNRRNYYYRIQRGSVAISAEGYRRLAELGIKSWI